MSTRMHHRPIGDLLGEFAQETGTLIGYEMELARSEVSQATDRARRGAVALGIALALAMAGLGALTACAILGLAEAMDAWLAALIVGAVLLAVAGAAALIGRSRMRQIAPPVPHRAMDNLRRDVEAVQEGVQQGRSGNGGGTGHGA